MKRFLIHLIPAIFALGIASCSEDPATDGGAGTLRLHIAAGTRTDEPADAYSPYDYCTIRIYNGEGLIRRYKSIGDLPAEGVQLLAGEYRILAELGDNAPASFTHKSYRGEQRFTILPGQTIDAEVKCTLTNVVSQIVFEKSIADNFEAGFRAWVCASDAFSKADIADVPTLEFTEDGTGYFTMPKGQTRLSWCFEGTHTTLGAFSKTGVIEDVEPAHKYKLSFKFSPDLPGFLGFSATLDTSAEECDDTIVFEPDVPAPAIEGEGFDTPVRYVSGSREYLVAGSAALAEATLRIGDRTLDLMAIAAGTDTAEGVTAVQEDEQTLRITLSEAFFATMAAGDNTLTFLATDVKEGRTEAVATARLQGIVPFDAQSCDLWNNTATFTAVVFDAATEVKAEYRTAGGTWIPLTTVVSDDTAAATAAPVWVSSQNAAGLTVHTPQEGTGIFAGGSYEYRMTIGGTEYPPVAFTAPQGQTIPDGDMEDTSMSCFNNNHGSYWDSGNNSLSKPLCSAAIYTGMEGSNCAKLTANKPILLVNLAAGNLFTGSFKQSGTSGQVSFGQPYVWTARPRAMKVLYQAALGEVNQNQHNGPLAVGTPDKARIFVAIVDWGSQHVVTSGSKAPTGIWDPATMTEVGEGAVIGYGSLFIESSTEGETLHEATLDIYYYDTTAKPSGSYTLVISCATSAYGDYMNGCTTNVMHVDDFKWAY